MWSSREGDATEGEGEAAEASGGGVHREREVQAEIRSGGSVGACSPDQWWMCAGRMCVSLVRLFALITNNVQVTRTDPGPTTVIILRSIQIQPSPIGIEKKSRVPHIMVARVALPTHPT